MNRQISMLPKKKTKKVCPQRIYVGLELVPVGPLYWSINDMCHEAKFLKKGLRISCIKTGVNPHEIIDMSNA